MSRESILKIRETEQVAEDIVESAKAQAREMLAEAERRGEALCTRIQTEVTAEWEHTMQQVDERTAAMTERAKQEAANLAEELCKNATLHQRSAEKIVIRGLMSKCR